MWKVSPAILGLMVGVWWLLAGAGHDGWLPGIVAVVIGGLLYTRLGGGLGTSLSMPGLLRFIPYFLQQSLLGGVDVAFRALSPSLPLEPAFIRYPIRLEAGEGRYVFLNTISLLPGTFSARLEARHILVHALADGEKATGRLRELEGRVADLFGVTLEDDSLSSGGET